jgi:alcohol dehydrogenase class IV
MNTHYLMPTRIVSGAGALRSLTAQARKLGLGAVLVVTDAVIAKQRFYDEAVRDLEAGGLRVERFERCAIDARVAQVDALAQLVREQRLDGVVSIGGGSVMCAGKGIAIAAANGCSILACTGADNFTTRALPMIMVPTTAGSGSEVSQWTVIKDDDRHVKLVCGGPLSFPDVAILDPVTLESLPAAVAASTGVDALTHALEAYTSALASPLTDALALEAVRLLSTSLRGMVGARSSAEARAACLLASSMANMACGNARLGHAHALSLSLESLLDLPHPLGVGVLVPHTLAFNLVALPEKPHTLAAALGARVATAEPAEEAINACVSALHALYDDIGFPTRWTDDQVPRARIRALAEFAVPGLYAGSRAAAHAASRIDDDTPIVCPSPREMRVCEAEAVYAACLS